MMLNEVNGAAEVRGTVCIRTQGCKLNQADSESLARRFIQAGYRLVSPSESADIYVVNTCTVTHVADAKARQAIRAAHRENPSALVVATGCYAQRAPGKLADVEGVDLIVGNTEKDRIVEMVLAARGEGQPVPWAVGKKPSPISKGDGFVRTRAMVKIQEGCNQVCAYCIVPKVRGREHSIRPEVLLSEVRRRLDDGYKEVVRSSAHTALTWQAQTSKACWSCCLGKIGWRGCGFRPFSLKR